MCSASATAARRGHPEADRVGPGGGYLDGVLEPLPRAGPAHVVRAGPGVALRVGGGLKVDTVGAVAVGGAVDSGDAVGDALPAGVVVGRVYRAGHGRGRPAERRVTARAAAAPAARGQGERHEVEVPAVGVLAKGERLRAGRQGDAGGDGGPGFVAAGVRHGDGAGEVGARGVGDVQRVGDPVRRGNAEGDRVGARCRHADGVVEPLPGRGPAHVIGARAGRVLRVGGGLQVDPVGAVAVGGAVGRGDVVRHALAAGVVVRRVDRAWHRRRRAPVRGAAGSVSRVRCTGHHRQGGQNRDHQGRRPPVAPWPGPLGPGQSRDVK